MDNDEGTKENPVPTIERAIALWKTKPAPAIGVKPAIYLCAETFDSAGVPLPAGAVVYGELDCHAMGDDAWSYRSEDAYVTVITAPEGVVPLRLESGAGVTVVNDIHVIAKSVTAMKPGGSSIAVIANQVNVTFGRSVLETGNGAPGAAGTKHTDSAQAGKSSDTVAQDACASGQSAPTAGPVLDCSGETSVGGNGGSGGFLLGAYGGNGSPFVDMNGIGGKGGSATSSCKPGQGGANGYDGNPGPMVSGIGTLNWDSGYVGVFGLDGDPGTRAQGGGGGGGSASADANDNSLCSPSTHLGASGGSGGTGGCGGAGGKGGGPGGSAIAVVSLNSNVVFKESKVRVGNGGQAGKGSDGQLGGLGGAGGKGGAPKKPEIEGGCDGGAGGNGGKGGKGADGLGGHAIGIAYTGSAPTLDAQSKIEALGMVDVGSLRAETAVFP